jgi:hypothetical protein
VEGPVTTITVVCNATSYFIGGTITGLDDSVTLTNLNNGDSITLTANDDYTFDQKVPSGGKYHVQVSAHPTGQTCTVENPQGQVTNANVTNINVVCDVVAYNIGGTVSGLVPVAPGGEQLILRNNDADDLRIIANGEFTFSTPVAEGSTYNVTIHTQPTGQTCTLVNESGTATGDVINIVVECELQTFTISGTISGLTEEGLVLYNQLSGDTLHIPPGTRQFQFPTPVEYGGTYKVAALTQPANNQICTISNSLGFNVIADVTNVEVICSSTTYTIGGTQSGLGENEYITLFNNQAEAINITAGQNSFEFKTPVAQGSSYYVTIGKQPGSYNICKVAHGIGTDVQQNITTVEITCRVELPPGVVTHGSLFPTALYGTSLNWLGQGKSPYKFYLTTNNHSWPPQEDDYLLSTDNFSGYNDICEPSLTGDSFNCSKLLYCSICWGFTCAAEATHYSSKVCTNAIDMDNYPPR